VSFRRKPESRAPGENRDPVFEIVPGVYPVLDTGSRRRLDVGSSPAWRRTELNPSSLPCLPVGRLYKREKLPLFGYLFPAAQAGKRGEGRFSEEYVLFIMDSSFTSIISDSESG